MKTNDGRQGSNDESVSANRYNLYEGSSNFIAERTTSNVADADGSDGENNIIAAYNENKGITGKSRSLGNERWNGDKSTYISDSELENAIGSCPGENIRCVASIDIETDQSGWLNSPSSSYTIKVE